MTYPSLYRGRRADTMETADVGPTELHRRMKIAVRREELIAYAVSASLTVASSVVSIVAVIGTVQTGQAVAGYVAMVTSIAAFFLLRGTIRSHQSLMDKMDHDMRCIVNLNAQIDILRDQIWQTATRGALIGSRKEGAVSDGNSESKRGFGSPSDTVIPINTRKPPRRFPS